MSRILFIVTQSEIGGAQRFLLEFAPYLASHGHEIVVAAGEGDGELFKQLESRIKNLEFRNYFVKTFVRNINPIRDALALIALMRIIKAENPEVLFLQSTKAGFLGSLAAKIFKILNSKFRIHVVYRIGGWSFSDPRSWWMNKILFWMEKISARWKDVIIVNSEFDRKIAIDKKIVPPEKIVKIYNGINPERLKFLTRENAQNFILSKITTTSPPVPLSFVRRGGETRGEDGASSHQNPLLTKEGSADRSRQGVVVVGTIANLYATKGIEYLIGAARQLYLILNTKYLIQFVVLGEGPERPKLEMLIKKHKLQDKFLLVGRVPNASQYLKAFDVFVLPSVKEGFPWVLLEAMAAEVPIVATKVGAVPEVIEDGKDGLLAPPRDSNSLAEKIQKLLLQLLGPKTLHIVCDRERYVKNAKGKLKQFSLQKMLRESEKTIMGIKNHEL